MMNEKFFKSIFTAFCMAFCGYFGNKAAKYVDKKVDEYLKNKETESKA